jgi:hypothetical protein
MGRGVDVSEHVGSVAPGRYVSRENASVGEGGNKRMRLLLAGV